ncbi:mechanosensitive ion channel domain-containing protein [Rhizobium sp. SSA_523]|uniref:mechanosensitive ion channel domain-containing protein n=1 Tax=Rhizobium sp. SSA_523 TaxID=2952477 RepID=UPI0020911950|nr:mechanosensitive ion channel domain-containing protein [Rhizobium sp. SSA_523]MCO5730208.1 mechanosensitive ion channel [Rhizobium sp. SSA_523]WKC25268.1 mechanosensitive ion channel [Rhizobium sp. SSA_523]
MHHLLVHPLLATGRAALASCLVCLVCLVLLMASMPSASPARAQQDAPASSGSAASPAVPAGRDAGGAAAQEPASQEPASQGPAPGEGSSGNPDSQTSRLAQVFDKARQEFEALRDKATSSEADDAQLAEIKTEVDTLVTQVTETNALLQERLKQIEARLADLGEPPGAGKPAESALVTGERDHLLAERSELNALSSDSAGLTAATTGLSNRITERRRQMFSDALLRHTDLSMDMINEAGAAFVTELRLLADTVGSWAGFVLRFKLPHLLTAMALSLGAATFFLFGSYRVFGRLARRNPALENPPYITRLSFAFWSLMVPALALSAFLVATYLFLTGFNVLRPDLTPLVGAFFGFIGGVFFVARLSYLVFAPDFPQWRLVRLSNLGARRVFALVVAMALINGLDLLLATVSEVLNSPLALTIIKNLVASIIIGLILIALSFLKPVLAENRDPRIHGRAWPRGLPFLLRIAGLALIVAALTGYVGLARFGATQIVVTGALLVTMYIGLLSGKAVAKQGAFGETAFGRYLQRRFTLGTVALDQIGLAASFGIYGLALLFGVPLILLTWGFQIQDIQSAAYRLFTRITIGNISISIVGICAGILLFAFAYMVTRWIQRWVDGNIMARSQVDAGVRNSVKTGIGYLGVGLALVFGVSAAGVDLSSLALVASALSVGIGFGLQNIVSNFVSGLILLVERPFKVGDHIVTGTTEGIVKRISVRATEIETFRKQSIIVPNSELINASVGNWTHKNRMQRSEIPVGVSYDADPRQVMDILIDVVRNTPQILQNPEPHVDFVAFGASSLDFEVRFFIADISDGIGTRAHVRTEILRRFKEAGIEIPYPHQDVKISGTLVTAPADRPDPSAELKTGGEAAPESEAESGPDSETGGAGDPMTEPRAEAASTAATGGSAGSEKRLPDEDDAAPSLARR